MVHVYVHPLARYLHAIDFFLQVPQIDSFSDTAQLHGRFVIELKKRWPCQIHQGEHGEAGYCYIAPSGEHTRLNPIRMKAWAAALVGFATNLYTASAD